MVFNLVWCNCCVALTRYCVFSCHTVKCIKNRSWSKYILLLKQLGIYTFKLFVYNKNRFVQPDKPFLWLRCFCGNSSSVRQREQRSALTLWEKTESSKIMFLRVLIKGKFRIQTEGFISQCFSLETLFTENLYFQTSLFVSFLTHYFTLRLDRYGFNPISIIKASSSR